MCSKTILIKYLLILTEATNKELRELDRNL